MKLLLPFFALSLLMSCGSSSEATGADTAGAPGEQIESYLAANNLGEGETTSSGLVYIIEEPGGEETPAISDEITINYKGYLVDGTVFDQTSGRPRTFPLSALIPAWQEAIPKIGRDGKIKILAPPSTAYGNNPPPGSGITPQSVLVFDIELIDF